MDQAPPTKILRSSRRRTPHVAIALEQEMKAKTQEARAKVIEAGGRSALHSHKHSKTGILALWITIN